MSTEPLRLRQLLERLAVADVRFVLVGGLAVNAWGYLRATRDVDLVPDPSPPNLEKRSGPSCGPVIGRSSPPSTGGSTCSRVSCSLDDLLEMKRASNRLRDKDDLEALEAAHGDEPDAAV